MSLKQPLSFFLFRILIFFISFSPFKCWAQVETLNAGNSSEPMGFDFVCTTCGLQIYPKGSDFSSGQEGKIIISTRSDDASYPSSTYQNKDRRLKMKVVMPKSCAGQAVYFKVIDPDDQSPYESDANPDDNLDIGTDAGTFGGLKEITIIANEEMFNGQEVAVAETELTVTDRYSGDNYQILASLDNTFPAGETAKSIEFIAWKRLYVELDLMYRYGATLVVKHIADSDSNHDWLKVDNIEDFSIGQEITIFKPIDPSTSVTTIINIDDSTNKIQIPDLDVNYPQFAGIRISGLESTVTYSNELITQGFGEAPEGSDCGAFIEFPIWDYGESGFVPKFNKFKDQWAAHEYMKVWFSKQTDMHNVIYILGAIDKDYVENHTGYSQESWNHTIYFEEEIPLINRTTFIAELINHELGHHLNIIDDNHPVSHYHFDYGGSICPDGEDECVMSYGGNHYNGIAKFDNEDIQGENCHYFMRKAELPR